MRIRDHTDYFLLPLRHVINIALAILKKVTASDAKFLARATPATLDLLAGPKGVGCLRVAQWQRFGDWMHAQGLLNERVPASSVVTTGFLPARCR